ncbi:MAG: SGNH/GDSL hydrolase family protein [Bacteroidales bacterium]|nr:SGNH/GDSL hydrolase family protein [Bacteroidales bacterium]
MKRLFLIGLLGLALSANTAFAQTSQQEWKGTWATAEEAPLDPWDYPKESLSNRSVRQIIHVSIGGESLRMLISNEFGSSAVDIKSVYIANAGDLEKIDAKSAKYLTFNGKKNITLEPGQKVFCDDLAYSLKPLQRLSITVCYGDRTPEKPTTHRGSRTTSYIMKGESKPKSAFVIDEKLDHWYNIASLDVKTDHDTRIIAALGNSITDGRGTTTNMQNRWTDFLAEAYEGKVGVLNLGIGGNCVIEGGLSQPALKRFDRDILAQRGVKTLVIFEGVNDIGWAWNSEEKSKKLIEAYETLIEKARNAGMKVFMGTITPFKGNSYFNPWHETARQVVNEWIRTTDKIDGVIDFDAEVRDPEDPQKLKAEYSDDWLHLNPKGYEAMGKCAAKALK